MKNISCLVKESIPLLSHQNRIYITLDDHIGGSTVLKLLQFLYLGLNAHRKYFFISNDRNVAGEVEVEDKEADELLDLINLLRIDFGDERLNLKEVCSERTRKKACNERTRKEVCRERTREQDCNGRTRKEVCSERTRKQDCSEKTRKEVCSERTRKEVYNERTRKEVSPKSAERPPGPSRGGLVEGPERRLFCYCQQPSSKDMLGCDYCPAWYHPDCLALSRQDLQTVLQLPAWRCPECQAKGSRHCRKDKNKWSIPYHVPRPWMEIMTIF